MKTYKKIIIPVVRKVYPSKLAEAITSVQPMQVPAGSIFRMNIKDNLFNPWSEWRKTTSLWPRKSITSEWIIGRINKRGRSVWDNVFDGKATRRREFATNKELFTAKLSGDV